jgi:glutathione S-transferase
LNELEHYISFVDSHISFSATSKGIGMSRSQRFFEENEMSNAIKIHGFPLSGHSHRVELFANLAGINHEVIQVDLAAGEHKQPPFLKLNPLGKVPVIEDGDAVLADSTAILVYLARKYASNWLPSDPVEEAEVQKFLSLASNEIANGPAAARLVTVFGAPLDAEQAKAIAEGVFGYLEAHLNGREWLVGKAPSIADVAVYSYTAHAPEGGISLEPYPNIRAHLARVEALPGFVGMPKTPVGLAA